MTYSTDDMDKLFSTFKSRVVEKIDYKPRVAGYDTDYIHLENIACQDADGKVFENYENISISRRTERDAEGNYLHKGFSESVNHLHDKGHLLPSMALQCNIIDTIYDAFKDELVDDHSQLILEDFLIKYFEKAQFYRTNTIVNYKMGRISHYPWAVDIQSDKLMNDIDVTELTFDSTCTKVDGYSINLEMDGMKRFFKNFTGMQEPEKLSEIAWNFQSHISNYFVTTSEINTDDIGFALLGQASPSDFRLMTDNCSNTVIRGVLLK